MIQRISVSLIEGSLHVAGSACKANMRDASAIFCEWMGRFLKGVGPENRGRLEVQACAGCKIGPHEEQRPRLPIDLA